MKCEVSKEKAFVPVTISLTCETQGELNFWGRLFNATEFVENVPWLKTQRIYKILQDAGADINTGLCNEKIFGDAIKTLARG